MKDFYGKAKRQWGGISLMAREPSETHMAGIRMKQGKHKGTKFEAL